jgi:hypothetical protein
MQNNRFVVLTGHLSNYPLSDLIGILRHQRKTGRLLIEYAKGPASLFFESGELVDVRLNELNGLQAICVLLAQPEASFNFNPLIKSSRRTIEPSFQRVVSELFGCWDDSPLEIESHLSRETIQLSTNETAERPAGSLEGIKHERLALPPARFVKVEQRSLLLIAAGVLIIIGISSVIAVTGTFKNAEPRTLAANEPSGANAQAGSPTSNQLKSAEATSRGVVSRGSRSVSNQQHRDNKSQGNKTADLSDSTGSETKSKTESSTFTSSAKADPGSASGAIKVVMQIENGRVLKASIANHAPGMDSFEALALRVARQRRYPTSKNGAETVTVSVNKPE